MIKYELNQKIDEFINSRAEYGNFEWYGTPREFATEVLEEFESFCFPKSAEMIALDRIAADPELAKAFLIRAGIAVEVDGKMELSENYK